jgi:hemolysin III
MATKPKSPPTYHPTEERLNVLTHGFGFVLSLVALVLLVLKSSELQGYRPLFSFTVFGASLVLLYAASTFYHSAKDTRLRHYLNITDHAAIYVLIAGTYTPFALITLRQHNGLFVFGLIWGIALAGILLKLFFIGKFNTLSTVLYVAMGWIVIFYIKPLMAVFPGWGVFWLFVGGLFYTLGAVIFAIEKIKFNHVIFHLFVLAGSFCHFIAIYFFVLG